MAQSDPRNPAGSDVIAERLHKERPEKRQEKRTRTPLISFEVTTAHKRPKGPSAAKPHASAAKIRQPAPSRRWRRVAIAVTIVLLLVLFFSNNYRKNVHIDNLKSANEEFAQAYAAQQARIAELQAELERARAES